MPSLWKHLVVENTFHPETTTVNSNYLTPLLVVGVMLIAGARPAAADPAPAHDYALPFGHDHVDISGPIAGDGPTLQNLLLYADKNAPLIRVANQEISIAEAQRIGADIRLPGNPVLGLGVGGRTTEGATRPEVSASISQPVWINGSRSKRLTVADAAEALAQAEVEVVRWQVHVEAHRLYIQAQIARQSILRANAMVEHAVAHGQLSQRKVELGEIAPPMLLMAQSSLARAQAMLLAAKHSEAELLIELAGWIGWPETTLPSVPVDSIEPPQVVDPEEMLAQMAAHHPSLKAREAAVAAAEAEAILVKSERTPTPSVGARYAFENEIDRRSHVWQITAEMPLPFAQKNQQARARAEAVVESNKARLALETRELRTKLWATAAALARYAEEVRLYEETVMPKLNQNLDLLARAFQLGEISIHEVALVHEQVLDSTQEYLSALSNYHNVAAALEGLVGSELWDAEEEVHP